MPMHKTLISHTSLMHKQDRNNYDRIFGGHLLRTSYEVAFSTAAMHCGSYCEPLAMDDVSFLHPVPIGCILKFESKVVYAEGKVLRIHVRAMKMEPAQKNTSLVTNDLWFSFVCKHGDVPPVVPESIQEGLEYLTAYKQHAEDLEEASQPGASGGAAAAAVPRSRL